MRTLTTLVLPALMAIASAPSLAQDSPPTYSTKEIRLGSNIPHNVVSGSRVPLDRPYADFTPEQKAIVRARYEAMDPNDEPPWPVNGLGVVFQQITEVERKLRIHDDLDLAVEVGSDGLPRSVASYRKSDPELVHAVGLVLMQTKFKPAVCHGNPCVMQFPVRLTPHL